MQALINPSVQCLFIIVTTRALQIGLASQHELYFRIFCTACPRTWVGRPFYDGANETRLGYVGSADSKLSMNNDYITIYYQIQNTCIGITLQDLLQIIFSYMVIFPDSDTPRRLIGLSRLYVTVLFLN